MSRRYRFEKGYNDESKRLKFVEERDGLEECVRFARMVSRLYKKHIISRKGMCADAENRAGFMGSVIYIKHFLAAIKEL